MLKICIACFQKIALSIFCLSLFAKAFGQPIIGSIAPTSGPVGTLVTITGTGFVGTQFGNVVIFGNVRASVSAATTTSITVTVPPGAGFGYISVTNNFYTAYSAQAFLPT